MKYNVKRHAVVQPQDESIRLIPLTQHQNAIVDAVDYERLMQWNWHAEYSRAGKSFYAVRKVWEDGRGTDVQMASTVMNVLGEVDHANHDTLDNRRFNLRPCTRCQNIRNRRKHRDNPNTYKGVRPHGRRWVARIFGDSKEIYLGSFGDKESAARAYDTAALRYFGEFAHLNFPR